jgi:hypothetical protein
MVVYTTNNDDFFYKVANPIHLGIGKGMDP